MHARVTRRVSVERVKMRPSPRRPAVRATTAKTSSVPRPMSSSVCSRTCLWMNRDRKLPPRLHLPRARRPSSSARREAPVGRGRGRPARGHKAASAAGCSVANWECIRATAPLAPGDDDEQRVGDAHQADGLSRRSTRAARTDGAMPTMNDQLVAPTTRSLNCLFYGPARAGANGHAAVG